MKNQKFLSLAFVIALLCTFVPQTLAGTTDVVNVQATVGEAINITIADTVVSPSIVPGATTSPDAVGDDDKTIVTIDSNDPSGATVSVGAADLASTADFFCIEATPTTCTGAPKYTTDGADGGDAAWLKLTTSNATTADHTYQTNVKVDGATTVFASTDALIEDDTFDVVYDFYADYGLAAALYEGNLTFTIAGL